MISPPKLPAEDERTNQFATRRRAQQYARLETMRTNREHGVIRTRTYRGADGTPLTCWTTCLTMDILRERSRK